MIERTLTATAFYMAQNLQGDRPVVTEEDLAVVEGLLRRVHRAFQVIDDPNEEQLRLF
jgi:hypothetical protein